MALASRPALGILPSDSGVWPPALTSLRCNATPIISKPWPSRPTALASCPDVRTLPSDSGIRPQALTSLRCKAYTAGILTVAFSPDDAHLASGSWDPHHPTLGVVVLSSNSSPRTFLT